MRHLLVVLVALPATARAGGMMLPLHGVHSVERAGAIVAGTEDADALWSNPAGLGHLTGESSLLVDAAFVAQSVDYARIDSGGTQLAAVANSYPGIAVPTVAASFPVNDRLVLAGGFTAPYAGLHRYDPAGPQRYASSSLAESLFVIVTAGAAYAITPRLRVGVTVQDVVSKLATRVTLSACPGQTICAPEDPEFDADTKITQTDAFSPSGSAGVQFDATDQLTLGLVVQAPAKVSGTGKLETKVPSSSFFDGSHISGDQVSLDMTLPPSLRAGVEARPDAHFRIEAAIDIELWSMHDQITITPHDVQIVNAAGVGMYTIGTTVIPRHYKNSYAPSIGGEYRTGPWQLGAGYSYETAAAPKGYVSVLTVDSAKHIVGLGGGYDAGRWQVGAAFGFVALVDVDVPLDMAKVPQLTPIRDQPGEVPINAGTYRSHYVLAGMRFARKF